MPLDPQVRRLLDSTAGLPAIHELSPAEARRQMLEGSAALGDPVPVDSVTDRTIPGSRGEIPVRVYRPAGQGLPVVVYFHGGGWVIGSVETHDVYCRSLADAASVIVVSVEYRLAPEHRYPAAAEDAYEATRWVGEHAGAFGGRSGALVVAGDSAGGNLAAVVALMARDRGGPAVAGQILIYPITDHDFNTPSYLQFANDYFLTRETMMWFWDHYAPRGVDRDQAYLSPLRAQSLQGLPPALIMTAEYDPLRDEAEAYAEMLRRAGVEVTLTRYVGMIHGFTRRFKLLDRAQPALDQVAAVITRMTAGRH
jgi:acetyl esterase